MTVMRVTDVATYAQGNSPVAIVAGRTADGERRPVEVTGTKPYCYIPADEPIRSEVIDEHVRYTEKGYESFDGVPLKRVYGYVPDDIPEIREKASQHYEAGIPFYRRCMMDYGLTGYIDVPEGEDRVSLTRIDTDPEDPPAIEPRVLLADIEVLPNDQHIEQMKKDAEQPVTAITAYDTQAEQYHAFVLTDDYALNSAEVKQNLEAHWGDERAAEFDVDLTRCETEDALLDGFSDLLSDVQPDLLSGWNWTDFDHRYLLNRYWNLTKSDESSVDIEDLSDVPSEKKQTRPWSGIPCLPGFDMMETFCGKLSRTKWRSTALDYVAEKELGHGKMEGASVREQYENDREALIAYNIIDVQLTVLLDQKRDVHAFFYTVAELCGISIEDAMYEMRNVDGFIMSRADTDEILPTQDERDVPENAGGLVLPPASGINEWVGVIDLKSLYPSAMITGNISPETLCDPEDADLDIPWVIESDDLGPEGVKPEHIEWGTMGTTLETQGIVPKFLRRLFYERESRKAKRDECEPGSVEYERYDRQQAAVKVIMNSFYGVSSNDYWRLATDGLGDAITSLSRYALYKGVGAVRDIGYEVTYGDTDSCFVSLKRDEELTDEAYKRKAVSDGKGLTNQVNHRMGEVADEMGVPDEHPYMDDDLHGDGRQCLVYEFEKLYRRYIQFGKKKRYAGLKVWEEGDDVEKMDVSGFESRRSSSPELTSEAQPKVLKKILGGEGFDGVAEYVSGLCDDIEDEAMPVARIAVPKSISKPRDQYDSVTATLKACQASEAAMGKQWAQGDDPFVVYLSRTPADVEAYSTMAVNWNDGLPEGYEMDASEHMRKSLQDPLAPILDEVGWSWTEVKNNVREGDALDTGDDWGVSDAPQVSHVTEETEADDDPSESSESDSAMEVDW